MRRGFSLVEIMLMLALLSLFATLITVPEKLWEKKAVILHIKTARFVSYIKRERIPLLCSPGQIKAHRVLPLHRCQAKCSPIVFHPSGFVTPAGHILLSCGSRKWKITVSPLGRIRVFELGTKKTVGDKEYHKHNNPGNYDIPSPHPSFKGSKIRN